ncbi:TraB/GumN family protein [Clostridium intestinale]|uniref:GumN family protein n=1 Tax=Clostridium intestinale URNW TaxID=1294142 RepID=U2NIU4_9CLOT|nr:TraB/GumN family protein [Clostridium intestinale]ERK29038.1 hypothetical protein CINTURNW_3641 [Clostridium intestinale URNW]
MRKLKSVFITLLSVIILTASLVSCESKKNDIPTVQGLFYKVEKDGNYLYLGGSVHVGKEVKFIDSVEKAYKESDGLGVEINIQDKKLSEALNKEMMYPEGDNLLNHITPETKDKIEKIVSELGLKLDYKQYKLWALQSVITNAIANKAELSAYNGIDYKFITKATVDKKPVISLENVDIQLKAINAGGDELQSEVINNLPEIEEQQKALGEMYEAVINGDIPKIEKYTSTINSGSELSRESYNYMAVERNKNMISKIEGFISENKKYFIVVGAGHIVGEDGIIRALEDKGYAVTRLE